MPQTIMSSRFSNKNEPILKKAIEYLMRKILEILPKTYTCNSFSILPPDELNSNVDKVNIFIGRNNSDVSAIADTLI